MALLLDALFGAVAFGHFAVDLLNGQRAVLLAYLSGPLGLTNTALGFFSTLYVIAGALFQPVFGFIVDRVGARWVAALGILWMAVFFGLALVVPGTGALWLLILASLGSAAYHPAGTMQATLRGRTHLAGRETTSTAYFFVFGQTGHFFGPLLAGPLLDRFGPIGLLWLAVGLGVVGIFISRQLVDAIIPLKPTLIRPVVKNPGSKPRWTKFFKFPVVAFALVAAFQAWSQQNMITFVPKYLSDLGQSSSAYGVVAALFMGGSAFGSAVGGNLADKFGKRRVAVTSLALASVPLFLVSLVGGSPWLYLIIPVAGALTGAVHSILVVFAQRLIPGGMALASGLILGFMFSAGAIGTSVCGYLADQVGFPFVFQLTSGIALAGSILAITLQKE